MIKKSLIFIIVAVLFVGIVGCSENEYAHGTILTPSEGEVIPQAEAERITGLIQNYPSSEGTIKCSWDEITGSTGKQEWLIFRPDGYSSPEIYYVELHFENSVEGNDYQLVVQWLLNLETGSMRDISYQANGAISDKLSVTAIMETLRENQ